MVSIRRLCSLSGRLARRPFALILAAVFAVCAGVAMLLAATATVPVTAIDPTAPTLLLWSGIALLAWIVLAAAVKRLHDRDRSGWWLLLFVALPWGLQGLGTLDRHGPGEAIASLVGFALAAWGVVELVVRPGTAGPNHHGPDPRAAEPTGSAAL